MAKKIKRFNPNDAKTHKYHINVYSRVMRHGGRETALNTYVYGTSIEQVTKTARTRYPKPWIINVKRLR